MAGRSKPKRRRQAGPVDANPVTLALRRAAKLPPAEVEQEMREIQLAFVALRAGVARADHWSRIAGSVEVALAIESQGVIRGLQAHLEAAEEVLRAIRRRAMESGQWQAPTLYASEISALDDFTWQHRRQLEVLSDGEFRRAHDLARTRVLSAGGTEVDRRTLEL